MFGWTTVSIIMSGLWTFLKPVLLALLSEVKDELLELALDTVKGLKETDLTSTEKREAAFDAIKANALETGQELSDSTINLVLEMAVNKLKAEIDK